MINTFTLRLLTAVVVVLATLCIIGYDFWMSWLDNDSTISKLILWITSKAPVTMMVVSFWAGLLCGHLFMPQEPLKMLASRWNAKKNPV